MISMRKCRSGSKVVAYLILSELVALKVAGTSSTTNPSNKKTKTNKPLKTTKVRFGSQLPWKQLLY